jgi:hypothetical protein
VEKVPTQWLAERVDHIHRKADQVRGYVDRAIIPELSDRRVRDIEPSDIARSEPTETASKVPRAAPEAARRQGRSYPCSRA